MCQGRGMRVEASAALEADGGVLRCVKENC